MIAKGVLTLAITAVALFLDLSARALAQTFPSRPITMVVPYAAGGSTDVVARILALRMKASLGQPIIVENVTGASGSIGVGRVARAVPDGYTLSLGQSGSNVMNGAIYSLQYDLLNDFEPIALIATDPLLILAKNAIPAGNLTGLIAWLKVNPGTASMGNSGVGAISHVAGILFQKETATQLGMVPYRGGAPAMQDLAAGQIDLQITDAATSLAQVRAGVVKAYAVTAKARLSSASHIPTVDEAGLPGFYASVWFALWAPKGTPKTVVAKLNGAVRDVLADPSVPARLSNLGLEIFPREQQTPEALNAFQKAEMEKWWPIIKAAGIKAE
jgi:tripartite-type tricarboxylate transporter receptor subunit TctC